jgi:Protein of unknown function (DUF2442)
MVNSDMSATLKAEIKEARKKGSSLKATEPRANAAWYDQELDQVVIELTNGVITIFPRALLQGLAGASVQALEEIEITPSGYGLHWESLDIDLGVPELMAGIFGAKAWMTELGRKGGQVRSDAKSAAARANGLRGGRPRRHEDAIRI